MISCSSPYWPNIHNLLIPRSRYDISTYRAKPPWIMYAKSSRQPNFFVQVLCKSRLIVTSTVRLPRLRFPDLRIDQQSGSSRKSCIASSKLSSWRKRSIPASTATSILIIKRVIFAIDLCDFRDQWVIKAWSIQERADAHECH